MASTSVAASQGPAAIEDPAAGNRQQRAVEGVQATSDSDLSSEHLSDAGALPQARGGEKSTAEAPSKASNGEKGFSIKFPSVKHHRVMVEMAIYISFLACFSLVVLNQRDPQYSFQLNAYMRDLFLEEEFPDPEIYKTFYDVATVSEFWEYLRAVWVVQLLSDQGGGKGVMYGTNWLVGSARFRQVRLEVNGGRCFVPADFSDLVSTCYPAYDTSHEDTQAYGPNNTWTHSSAEDLGAGSQLARLRRYSGGGFVQHFGGGSLNESIAQIDFLINNDWVDLQTAAVFVDWTVYNPSINLFLVCQLQFEFLASGGVHPDYRFRVLRMYRYNGANFGTLQAVGEVMLVVYVAFFMLLEAWHIYMDSTWTAEHQAKVDAGVPEVEEYTPYFKDAWNFYEWLIILLFVTAFFIRLRVDLEFDEMNLEDPGDRTTFHDFNEVVAWDITEINVLAVNAGLLWFKVFKFTHFAPSMGMIAKVLARAAKPMLSFIVMVAFILFGFSQAGTLAFGADVENYRTLSYSITTGLLATLGLFEFESLRHSNRAFGPLFFFSFVVIVFFILLSVFVAIVNGAYEDVNEELQAKKGKGFFTKALAWVSTTGFGRKAAGLLAVEKQLKQLQEDLAHADDNADGVLDEDELRDIAEDAKLLFAGGAEEMMALYDVDKDGGISEGEQEKMMADVKRRQEEVARKIKKLKSNAPEDLRLLFELLSDRNQLMEARIEAKIDELVDSLGQNMPK